MVDIVAVPDDRNITMTDTWNIAQDKELASKVWRIHQEVAVVVPVLEVTGALGTVSKDFAIKVAGVPRCTVYNLLGMAHILRKLLQI